jgi:RNA polymerase sigma-70 factor (ECF subfamily)
LGYVIDLPEIVKMLKICFRKGLLRFLPKCTIQEPGSFGGLIRRIIVHTCINILKKNKKFADSVDLIHANSIHLNENNIPSILQAKQVVESIRLLPLGYRTVLNLYAIEGFSHKEIAAILDIEESTSRSQYTRAKAMLEDILIRKKIIQKPKQRIGLIATANNGNERF